MDNNERKKIKDYLNSPDTDLLEIIYDQFDTPNADLAKWILNYRLYENMVRLNQSIEKNNSANQKYQRYMFWLASFMSFMTLLNLLFIMLSTWINIPA
ncbi:hypothetical protein KKH39_01395 [Patescibacteria group bacterium]|nr:hypothetical protein [Patescibacteria group bacterium]